MIKLRLLAMIGFCLVLLFGAASLAFAGETYIPIHNEFSSAVVMRADGKILYSFKPDKPHTAASLTKLVMGIVMTDRKWNWGSIIKMSASDEVGGGRLRVSTGARVVLADLWQSAIGSSANNAATAIARFAGPGVSAFVKKMNAKVKTIGAVSSTFYDPSGMNPKNITTAKDMALIARAAFRQDRIVQASQSGTYTFMLAGSTKTHTIRNTNAPLLADPDVYLVGGKTGYLPESKYNYVAQLAPLAADGKSKVPGKDVIVVVLGSASTESAMASAKRLAEWAWSDESRFHVSKYQVPERALAYGARGDDVRWVQEVLKITPVSGYFGPVTRAAVQKFQETRGIAKSGNIGYGVVGPATRAKLLEVAP